MANPYYNPEDLGLTQVAEIDYSDGCYVFDTRVVWRHRDGRLFTARDSGCSCPTPFEQYCSLLELDPLDIPALEAEVNSERYHGPVTDKAEFLQTVREATRKTKWTKLQPQS